MKQTKPTGGEQLKKLELDTIFSQWLHNTMALKVSDDGTVISISKKDGLYSAILDWHEEKVAEAKRELVEKLMEEVDDWYSLAPAYRNKSELVGKIKSLLLAELSDEEVAG